MRDLTFYPTIEEYRQSIYDRFDPLFLENTFYRNLIDYTIDCWAPIFYRVSHPSEHFAFSGAYHFETEREGYPNIFRRNLFWLHDFTHMMFSYQWDVYTISERKFLDEFIYQERIASTETEIFAYYRIPELREKVFQDEYLYYDLIRDRGHWGRWNYAGHQPDAGRFLHHRNRLVNDDAYGEAECEGHPEILHFFQQWRRLTPKWVGERYKSMVGIRLTEDRKRTAQIVDRYEQRIAGYNPSYLANWPSPQARYESVTLKNVRRAYEILRWSHKPETWEEVPHALKALEGAVFFQG